MTPPLRDPRVTNPDRWREDLDFVREMHVIELEELRHAAPPDDDEEASRRRVTADAMVMQCDTAVRLAYVLGEPMDEVREDVRRLFAWLPEALRIVDGHPDDMVHLGGDLELAYHSIFTSWLAWAVCYHDVPGARAVLAVPPVAAAHDGAIDELAVLVGLREVRTTDEVFHPTAWAGWLDIIDAPPDERPARLAAYVHGWVTARRRARMIHPPGHHLFAGSWCFEAAALAVALGIDDTACRPVPEYPEDLVDHARRVRGQVYERAAAVAPDLDGEALAARHPEVARWLVDVPDGDHAGPELLVLAAADHAGTMIELDWAGEDELGRTRLALARSCRALGLPVPEWDDDTEDIVLAHLGDDAVRGTYLPVLFGSLDAQLATVGVRLLVVDMDSDSYQVAPVPSERFAELCGAAFGPYRIDAAVRIEA